MALTSAWSAMATPSIEKGEGEKGEEKEIFHKKTKRKEEFVGDWRAFRIRFPSRGTARKKREKKGLQ